MAIYGRVLRVTFVVFLASAGGSAVALAADNAELAKEHFTNGTRRYEVGDYAQALAEFKAAHMAKPDPAFLYNIAQCHRQMGELEQAVVLYKRYLAASPNAANRAEVEKRIVQLDAEIAAKRGRTAEPPARAQEAPSIASPPPASSAPGTGAASPATAPLPAGAPPAGENLAASPGLAVQPTVVTSTAPAPGGSVLRTLRWVGLGLTAALAGGAILTGISASTKYNDLKNGCGQTQGGCPGSEVDKVKTRALVTNILWGATGAAAIGTGVAFYLAPGEASAQVAWRF
jgi:hypothetical protein